MKLLDFINGSELSLDIFESNAIRSDYCINKIRNEYHISYFDTDFVCEYEQLFNDIYSVDIVADYANLLYVKCIYNEEPSNNIFR